MCIVPERCSVLSHQDRGTHKIRIFLFTHSSYCFVCHLRRVREMFRLVLKGSDLFCVGACVLCTLCPGILDGQESWRSSGGLDGTNRRVGKNLIRIWNLVSTSYLDVSVSLWVSLIVKTFAKESLRYPRAKSHSILPFSENFKSSNHKCNVFFSSSTCRLFR